MAEPIEIPIRFPGTEEAARGVVAIRETLQFGWLDKYLPLVIELEIEEPEFDDDTPAYERLDAVEAAILREVLLRQRWNKTRAAQELGLSRVGLRAKLQRFGLDEERLARDREELGLVVRRVRVERQVGVVAVRLRAVGVEAVRQLAGEAREHGALELIALTTSAALCFFAISASASWLDESAVWIKADSPASRLRLESRAAASFPINISGRLVALRTAFTAAGRSPSASMA